MASVMSFVLPANLVDSVRTDPAPGRHEWLSVLPDIVVDLADRWSLRLGPPYRPGGRCAWVAPARDPGGRDLVLKLAWRDDEHDEADGLRAWAGAGAVLVHDSAAFDSTSALLLERCHPGTPLGHAQPEPEQDQVVAGLLQRLWRRPPPATPSGRYRRCATPGPWTSTRSPPRPSSLIPGWPAPGSTSFAASRPPPIDRCCCAPTSTPATCWRQNGNRGSSSTPNRTSATPPTMGFNTCSTAKNV